MAQQFFLFCNTGWMARYEGLNGKRDKIKGGGTYVDEYASGGEVCNFVKCADGYVYGHVETIKGELDRNIEIGKLGASSEDDSIGGIDVVWTATAPETGGRYVVGWYRNAQVFRQRQTFVKPPSSQHRLDEVPNFRIRARAEDAVLVPIERRDVLVQHGDGWLGHTPWWYPQDNFDKDPAIKKFLRRIIKLFDGTADDAADIAEIESSRSLKSTEKETLISARIGQGEFRKNLIREWKGCAVLGCKVPELLRASHIKPWRDSDNRERLDHNNGLLLLASLDAAFDCGLISFSDSGAMLVSSQLSATDRRLLGMTAGMKLRERPSELRQKYLADHRKKRFRR